MDCAWVVYGSTPDEADSSEPTVEHRRDVTDVFAQMAEIEIVALEKQLKTSQEGLVHMLHPSTNKPVPIRLIDIERREVQCRNERRPPAVTPPASRSASIYDEIDHVQGYYSQAFQLQSSAVDRAKQAMDKEPGEVEEESESATEVHLNVSSRNAPVNLPFRRYLIASGVTILLLIVVTVVVVAVVLATWPKDSNKVSCGGGEFKCADGEMCIPPSKLCDGGDDCGDSSDETNCTTITTPTPTTTTTSTTATPTTATAITTTTTTMATTPTTQTTMATTPTTPTTMATTPTTPTPGARWCILLIGGSGYGSGELVEYYHPTMDECDTNAIGTMSTEKINITMITSGCYLLHTQQIVIREVWNPNKPPMIYGMTDSSAKPLPLTPHGYTYASTAASISPTKCLSCGGTVLGNPLKACYQFDSSSPTEWTEIPSLSRALSNSASVSMDSEHSYYVIGGHDGSSFSNQLFRYSVDQRQWYTETSMAQQRAGHSAAVLSAAEFIVCGGENKRNDCEVYNTTQKKWRPVGNLTTSRQYFAMLSYNGTVYAIGGVVKGDLGSVEVYDVQTEKWTVIIKKLKHSRFKFVAVVV